MATGTDDTASKALSKNEAFAIIGNETRMEVLNELGQADEPVAFSELRERVGVSDSGQFNYHLDKLVGKFVDKTEEGYQLRQSGRRVVMAIQSGAVTHAPKLEATEIEAGCSLCEAQIEVTYHEEFVRLYCTECGGHYGDDPRNFGAMEPVKSGYLGSLPIPPAAVADREAEELYLASATWGHAYQLVMSSGVCPECGSKVDHSISVCEDHEANGSLCSNCNSHHPTRIHLECTHCISEWNGRFDNGLLSTTELQRFLLNHDLNLVAPNTNIWSVVDYEEEVLSEEPFRARYTWTIGQDALTLTVDDNLSIVGVQQNTASETA